MVLAWHSLKILNPSNNYATELHNIADMTDISSKDAWSSHVIINADSLQAGDVGKLVQFGAQNTATNYAPTGMYYDNMNVSKVTPATADDLFISETSEVGSTWTKYLEVANFTGADVSLDQYFLGRVSNAPSVVGEYEVAIEFTSGATIANGDVWVLGRAEGTDGPDALEK